MLIEKLCSACSKTKPASDFHKRSDRPCGLQSECKTCKQVRFEASKDRYAPSRAAYYLANREKKLADGKRREQANKNAIRLQRLGKRLAEPEKYKQRSAEAYAARREKHKVYRKKSRDTNKEAQEAVRTAWRKANKGIWAAYSAKRRSVRIKATPMWANLDKITEIYTTAAWLSETSGEKWHVDHIVPLQSPIVCGLHCEANLTLLPASENLSKGNRYWPDMPV